MGVQDDPGLQAKLTDKCFPGIQQLDGGQTIDESQIFPLIDFVNRRLDCSDFRLICLLKAYLAYAPLLSTKTLKAIQDCSLNFKYSMEEPGDDGMCYWSENHQILFASCEYLAGQLFPDERFSPSGQTGKEKISRAKKKILQWLENRFLYGFTEWLSNTYYEEDIAPLCVLVDHAQDEEIRKKAAMVLDLLFLDMALHSFQGTFGATSGRCYEDQKKDPREADVADILSHAFGIQNRKYDFTRLSALYVLNKNYRVPRVIRHIARSENFQSDQNPTIRRNTDPINSPAPSTNSSSTTTNSTAKGTGTGVGSIQVKESMGLDLGEVAREFPEADIHNRGMFLWAMEAFTNKESINMTMEMFNRWNLGNNTFLGDLQKVNISLLRRFGLLPLVIKILNPATQGVAIQRVNTCTYKTPHFQLSTAQNYHPGEFGDQQHIWNALLPGGISVFSTHPGSPMFDDPARNFSPSYWVGNGINPYAVQYNNVLLLFYDLNVRKGFLERQRQKWIHFYLPLDKFDQVSRTMDSIFCQKESTYLAICGTTDYAVKDDCELVFSGSLLGFGVILGDVQSYGSFEQFCTLVKESTLILKNRKLHWSLLHPSENPTDLSANNPGTATPQTTNNGTHNGTQNRDTMANQIAGHLLNRATYNLDCHKRSRAVLYLNGESIPTDYPRFDSPFVKAERKSRRFEITYSKKGLILDFDTNERMER